MKTCLTCKYEPEWGPLVGGDYPRRVGKCRWGQELPALPAPWVIKGSVTRYSDDSGIYRHCKTWEAKPNAPTN